MLAFVLGFVAGILVGAVLVIVAIARRFEPPTSE
jgi:hypothetical protein